MSLAFLNQKGFHPANKMNQRRLFIAEEGVRHEAQKTKELIAERQAQADEKAIREVFSRGKKNHDHSKDVKDTTLQFMYQPPPGFSAKGEHKTSSDTMARSDGAGGGHNTGGGGKGITKAYAGPSNRQGEKKQKTVPVGGVEGAVGPELPARPKPVLDIEEKFPVLKNAPVEGSYVQNVAVTHRPFGLQLRNVKCHRCQNWGHATGDRECPLYGQMDEKSKAMRDARDPVAQEAEKRAVAKEREKRKRRGEQEEEAAVLAADPNAPPVSKPKYVLKRTNLSPVRGGLTADNPLQQMVAGSDDDLSDDDSDDDVEATFLASLTKEQKKELLKRYTGKKQKKSKKEKKSKKKKSKKKKKSSDSSSD